MLLTLLILINIVIGCKDIYTIGEDVIISDIIEPEGRGATCNLTLYNELIFNQSGLMSMEGLAYEYNASKLSKGIYSAFMDCNITSDENVTTRYEGECKFEVTYGDKMIISVIILLPMILSLILLIGAISLNPEDHKALKLFLFLLSPIPFFASMHIAMISVIKFYDFPELQNLMGSTTYWVGWIFFIVITYFVIYLFYMIIHHIGENKKERLKY